MKTVKDYANEFLDGDLWDRDVNSLSHNITDYIFDNCTFLRFYEDEKNRQVLYAEGWYFLYMEVTGLKNPNVIMVAENIAELEDKCKTKFIKKNINKQLCFYDALKLEIQKEVGTITQEHFEWISTIDAKCSLLLFDIFNHTAMRVNNPNEYNKLVFNNRLKFLRFLNLSLERFQLYNSVKVERINPIKHKLIVNGIHKGDITKKSNKEYLFNGKTFYSFKAVKDWARLRKNIH